ncbi:hypothetical protein N7490_003271 [Penicillium lividum]|nr:hypothetical protein N7490_003271 [Penicillium lividum]
MLLLPGDKWWPAMGALGIQSKKTDRWKAGQGIQIGRPDMAFSLAAELGAQSQALSDVGHLQLTRRFSTTMYLLRMVHIIDSRAKAGQALIAHWSIWVILDAGPRICIPPCGILSIPTDLEPACHFGTCLP